LSYLHPVNANILSPKAAPKRTQSWEKLKEMQQNLNVCSESSDLEDIMADE
jgi:hypothetical protein